MNATKQTSLEQMRISETEIEHRKELLYFRAKDAETLVAYRPVIQTQLEAMVSRFYALQTGLPEIALLIGDADTLARLKQA